jgi:hypothetical protein
MVERPEAVTANGTPALYSRRKFLKRALLVAAYAAPVIVSYPRTVFAAHCDEVSCGGDDHTRVTGGSTMVWSPGCSRLA